MLEILQAVNEWLSENRKIALATVIETWGSAPRRVGAKMAITADMAMMGSVSGGCVETAVVEEAIKVLKKQQAKVLHYGVSDDTAWEVGLACGGKISILVEPLEAAWWQLAVDAVQQDKHMTTITLLSGEHSGAKMALDAAKNIVFASPLTPEQQQALILDLTPGQSRRTTLAGYDVMLDVYGSRPHLILIGGVHIAVALQQFAKTLGFRVSLVDPRRAFATPERFPDVDAIYYDYPDTALLQTGIDADTYIAVLTHDEKIDDPAIKTALAHQPAYIGVLSSKRTHEKRIARLKEAGISDETLARLNTPIGLDIGATTPEEIALAVLAQIIAVKNGIRQVAHA
jgi:xanthine dehydrogenase accessory factor